MKVQRRWRGAMTRQKLLHMLDHYKWRRKQIHNYFLPKSRIERQQAKRKFQVAVAQKDVSSKAARSKLSLLKDTILDTASANPLEDPARTAQDMNKSKNALMEEKKPLVTRERPPISIPVFAPYDTNKFSGEKARDTVKTKTGDDFNSRLSQEKTLREEELTNKDIRNARDLTMRQLLRIDGRPTGDQLEKYNSENNQGGLDLFDGTARSG